MQLNSSCNNYSSSRKILEYIFCILSLSGLSDKVQKTIQRYAIEFLLPSLVSNFLRHSYSALQLIQYKGQSYMSVDFDGSSFSSLVDASLYKPGRRRQWKTTTRSRGVALRAWSCTCFLFLPQKPAPSILYSLTVAISPLVDRFTNIA